jgi:hypothetical protein
VAQPPSLAHFGQPTRAPLPLSFSPLSPPAPTLSLVWASSAAAQLPVFPPRAAQLRAAAQLPRPGPARAPASRRPSSRAIPAQPPAQRAQLCARGAPPPLLVGPRAGSTVYLPQNGSAQFSRPRRLQNRTVRDFCAVSRPPSPPLVTTSPWITAGAPPFVRRGELAPSSLPFPILSPTMCVRCVLAAPRRAILRSPARPRPAVVARSA